MGNIHYSISQALRDSLEKPVFYDHLSKTLEIIDRVEMPVWNAIRLRVWNAVADVTKDETQNLADV